MQIIVFRNAENKPSLVVPTHEAASQIGVDFIARKDVPAGCRYLILEIDDLPSPDVWSAWDVSDDALTSGVGGYFGAGTDLDVIAAALVEGQCWVRCRHQVTSEESEFCVGAAA